MRREGHCVPDAWFKGEWCDEFQYAVLREEWTRIRVLDNTASPITIDLTSPPRRRDRS